MKSSEPASTILYSSAVVVVGVWVWGVESPFFVSSTDDVTSHSEKRVHECDTCHARNNFFQVRFAFVTFRCAFSIDF